jgi:hypothetical protein
MAALQARSRRRESARRVAPRATIACPVVVVTEEMSDPDVLVEAIRQALRRKHL